MDLKTLIDFNGHAEIPEGTDKIPQRAFKDCKELKSITLPTSVSVIQSSAFEKCESLTSISIPDSVKRIGRNCFKDCQNLTEVMLPQGITLVDYGLFSGCENLKEIVIPEGVTNLGDCVFYGCFSLTSISLPDRLEVIGEECFYGCRSLKSVLLPGGLKTVGPGAFNRCRGLSDIHIPDSVKEIGPYTFANCSSLRRIGLPKIMDKIGGRAFEECIALEYLEIPDGVSVIPKTAFAGCKAVHIHLSSTVRGFDTKGCWEALEVAKITISADNKALSVENDCVVDRNSRSLIAALPNATAFPQNIRYISLSERAFPKFYDVEELVIPEGVIHVDCLPFWKMTRLKKLQFPESLKSCGRDFMSNYPFPSVSVSPELFLSDHFKAWQDISKVNLIGIDSVSDELLVKIKEKYKNQKAGWQTRYGREGTGRLFWVYLNDQLVCPAAHIVKKKEEAVAAHLKEREEAETARLKKEAEEKLVRQRQEIADKLEDMTISSLCAATFENTGFSFKYDDRDNEVSVTVFDGLCFDFELNLEDAREDLTFLLHVATTYRNALMPYVEKSPAPVVVGGLIKERADYYVCGQPFADEDEDVFLSVQPDTLSIALQALKDLSKSYDELSRKYGEKFEKVSHRVEW